MKMTVNRVSCKYPIKVPRCSQNISCDDASFMP